MSSLLTPGQPGPEQQDAPLTEQERKLLVRLLSDPTYFPIEFRTWIRTYLEGSDIRLPSSAIVGGNAPRVNLPPGSLLPFAGGTIPSNTLLCNGQAVSRIDYKLLFDAIGTTWGIGNGTSTFNVPDLRDRALYGAGNVVGLAATDNKAIGSRGGPYHHHDISQSTNPSGVHSHGVSGSTDNPGTHTHGPGSGAFFLSGSGSQNAASGSAFYSGGGFFSSSGGSGAHTHSISGGTDSQGSHQHVLSGPTGGGFDLVPSYAGIQYCIATGKDV